MLITFLITIVFVSELIITSVIIRYLIKFDKKIHLLNSKIEHSKESIQEVSILARKISAQIKELTQEFVNDLYNKSEEILIKQVLKFVLSVMLFRKFRKLKLFKALGKGLSLLQIVV